MKVQQEKRTRFVVLAALLGTCLLVVTLHYEARRRGSVSLPEEGALAVLTPLQGTLTQFAFTLRERGRSIRRIGEIEHENRELRKQVQDLRNRNRRLNAKYEENIRLRKLLALDLEVPNEAVFAEVISLNTSNWFQRVRLNRGRKDRVAPKDVVMTDAGLVGQVIDVSRHTATVELIIDRESGVGARTMQSRATGVVRGTSEPNCELAYLDRDADVRVGDQVLTSGLGDVYPPGLIIGEVTEVHKDRHGIRHSATVKPATDFARLEDVYVRKGLRGAE